MKPSIMSYPSKFPALHGAPLVALILLFCFSLSPKAACGGEEGGELAQRLRLSAFGTLGVLYNPGSLHLQRDWQPDSVNGRFSYRTDSLLGAQADLHLADRLDATVQMVVSHRAEQSLDESLEWAFVRWRPLPDVTLRAGRLGFDFYLLSDYRKVGFAYLWQRPAVEFYGPLMIHNLNGGDASYSFDAGKGRVTAKVFAGVSRRSLQLGRDAEPDHISVDPVLGGRLSYEDERLRLSAGYARATLGENLRDVGLLVEALRGVPQVLWPDALPLAEAVSNEGKPVSFYSLGAAYETEDWIFQGEAGYLTSKWMGARDMASGYLSVGRHLGPVTPYLMVAAAKTLGSPPAFSDPTAIGDPATDAQLAALAGASRVAMNRITTKQQTLSLGARWDFHQNAALKVQWDLSRVGGNGSALWWTPGSTPIPRTTFVNLLSTSINFAF